jgi:hypothetical protein
MVLHPRAPRPSDPKERSWWRLPGHGAMSGGGIRASGMMGQQMMGFVG